MQKKIDILTCPPRVLQTSREIYLYLYTAVLVLRDTQENIKTARCSPDSIGLQRAKKSRNELCNKYCTRYHACTTGVQTSCTDILLSHSPPYFILILYFMTASSHPIWSWYRWSASHYWTNWSQLIKQLDTTRHDRPSLIFDLEFSFLPEDSHLPDLGASLVHYTPNDDGYKNRIQ